MEARCVNMACPYRERGGGCGLFPGDQWKICKRSGAVPAATSKNQKTRSDKHGK